MAVSRSVPLATRRAINPPADDGLAGRPRSYDGYMGQSLPGQVVAIPLPYKYWWSINNPKPNAAQYAAFSAATWAIIASPSLYRILVGAPVTATIAPATSASRSYTYKLSGEYEASVEIPFATPRDAVTLTVTVGGSGGSTVTRTLSASDRAIHVIQTPTPWDEWRTVTVTWTGGDTTAPTVKGTTYSRCRMLKTGALPAGWTAAPMPANFLGARTGTLAADQGIPISIDDAAGPLVYKHWLPDPDPAAPDYSQNVIEYTNYNTGAVSNIGGLDINKAIAGGGLYRTFQSHWNRIVAGSLFADRVGMTFWDGTAWQRTCSEVQDYKALGGISGVRRQVRNATAIYMLYDYPAPYTITLQYGPADYPFTGFLGGVDHTYTASHGGTGYEAFLVPVAYPLRPHSAGAIPDGLYCTNESSAVIIEDPMPLPFHIPCTDGTVILGGYHVDALTPVAGATIASVNSLDFLASDIPAGAPGLWHMKFTGRTTGVYTILPYDAGGSVLPYYAYGIYQATDGPDRFAAGGALDAKTAFHVAGDDLYAKIFTRYQDAPSWGNYKADDRHSGATVARISLVSHAVAHNAVSVGTTDIAADDAAWGVASHPTDTVADCPLFQKFTAPADGTYNFKITINGTAQAAFRQLHAPWAAWLSTSDQYCAHVAPDATDGVVECSLVGVTQLLTAPPVGALGTPAARTYAIDTGATGIWAGRDGQIATAWDPGIAGFTDFNWTYTALPDGGSFILNYSESSYGGTTRYVLRSGHLEQQHLDVLHWEQAMLSGETLYMRIGSSRKVGSRWKYGNGRPWSPYGATDSAYSIYMTVSAL